MATEARPAKPGFHYCAKHNLEYGALEQCGPCAAGDAAPLPDEVPFELPAAPKGCLSTEGIERWLTKLANDALVDAARVRKKKKKDFHDEIAIKSHRDVAVKAIRTAAELAGRREDLEIVNRRKRETSAGASHSGGATN